MAGSEREQAARRKVLMQLLEEPANRVCADCSTRNPRWASINLGCFLCIRCSGIHRNLGVHISKVRSVTLDRWTDDFVRVMVENGNAVVNARYEANMPQGFAKPTEDTPSRKCELFIRDKYEFKRYAAMTKAARPVETLVANAPPPVAAGINNAGRPADVQPAVDLLSLDDSPTEQQSDSLSTDLLGGADLFSPSPSRTSMSTSIEFGNFDQIRPASATPPSTGTDFADFSTALPSSNSPASTRLDAQSGTAFGEFQSSPSTTRNSASAVASASPSNSKSDILKLFSSSTNSNSGNSSQSGGTGGPNYRAALAGLEPTQPAQFGYGVAKQTSSNGLGTESNFGMTSTSLHGQFGTMNQAGQIGQMSQTSFQNSWSNGTAGSSFSGASGVAGQNSTGAFGMASSAGMVPGRAVLDRAWGSDGMAHTTSISTTQALGGGVARTSGSPTPKQASADPFAGLVGF